MTYSERWWRDNSAKVKGLLTRAERKVQSDPTAALEAAERVVNLMEAYGYPDWWSRVERLRQDALFARRYQDGGYGGGLR